MATQAEVYDIKTNLNIGGKRSYPAAFSITSSINRYSQLVVVHHNGTRAENSAIDITDDKVFKDMGQRQQDIFGSRSGPDTTMDVQVTGGKADLKVNFKGYTVSPQYAFAISNVDKKDECIDEFAEVDAFDGSIYGPIEKDEDRNFGAGAADYGKSPDELGWSIPKCVSSIIDDMVNKGAESFDDDVSADEEKNARKAQHAINSKVAGKIKKMLSDSEDTFGWKDKLAEMAEDHYGMADSIHVALVNRLTSASGSFMSTLIGIGSDFNCYVVPEDDNGKIKYKFINRSKIYKDMKPITLPITSMQAKAGTDGGLFPISYVACISRTDDGDETRDFANSHPYVAYPEQNVQKVMTAGGSVSKVLAPYWLPDMQNISTDLSDDGDPEEEGKDKMEQSTAEKAYDDKEKNRKEYRSVRVRVMKEWAKQFYLWQSLSASTVHLSGPLVKNISVGKYYNVKSVKGKELFKGFCDTVTYSVTTQGSRSATYTAYFTNVEFGSFQLPGKDE